MELGVSSAVCNVRFLSAVEIRHWNLDALWTGIEAKRQP